MLTSNKARLTRGQQQRSVHSLVSAMDYPRETMALTMRLVNKRKSTLTCDGGWLQIKARVSSRIQCHHPAIFVRSIAFTRGKTVLLIFLARRMTYTGGQTSLPIFLACVMAVQDWKTSLPIFLARAMAYQVGTAGGLICLPTTINGRTCSKTKLMCNAVTCFTVRETSSESASAIIMVPLQSCNLTLIQSIRAGLAGLRISSTK